MAPYQSDGPNYDSQGHPVCRHCGVPVNRRDVDAMDDGYCGPLCRTAAEQQQEGHAARFFMRVIDSKSGYTIDLLGYCATLEIETAQAMPSFIRSGDGQQVRLPIKPEKPDITGSIRGLDLLAYRVAGTPDSMDDRHLHGSELPSADDLILGVNRA